MSNNDNMVAIRSDSGSSSSSTASERTALITSNYRQVCYYEYHINEIQNGDYGLYYQKWDMNDFMRSIRYVLLYSPYKKRVMDAECGDWAYQTCSPQDGILILMVKSAYVAPNYSNVMEYLAQRMAEVEDVYERQYTWLDQYKFYTDFQFPMLAAIEFNVAKAYSLYSKWCHSFNFIREYKNEIELYNLHIFFS